MLHTNHDLIADFWVGREEIHQNIFENSEKVVKRLVLTNDFTGDDVFVYLYFMQFKNHKSKRWKVIFFSFVCYSVLNSYNVANTHVSTKIDEKNRELSLDLIIRLILVCDKFLSFDLLMSPRRPSQSILRLTRRQSLVH